MNGVSSRRSRCEQARVAARGGGDSSSSRAEDSVGPTHYLHYVSNWIGVAAGAGPKHSLSSLQDVSNWIGAAAIAGPILISPRHTNHILHRSCFSTRAPASLCFDHTNNLTFTDSELVMSNTGASLCFDYINNGSCTRLRTGGACKCRA